MDIQAKIQAARQAGYSDDEISNYMQQNNLSGAPSTMGLGGIGQVLHNATQAIPGWLGGDYIRQVLGAGYEGGRAIASALGDKNAYANQQTGQEVENPFLSDKDLQSYSNPTSGSITTALNTGEGMAVADAGFGITNLLRGAGGKIMDALSGTDALGRTGTKISQLLQKGDAALDATGNKQGILSALKDKYINLDMEALPKDVQRAQGYKSILPPVTSGMKTELLQELRHETSTMGAGDELGTLSLQGLQDMKTAAGNMGKFFKGNNTLKEQMYQNYSNALGNMIREAVPQISKQYDRYSELKNAAQNAPTQSILQRLGKAAASDIGGMLRWGVLYPTARNIGSNIIQGTTSAGNWSSPVQSPTSASTNGW